MMAIDRRTLIIVGVLAALAASAALAVHFIGGDGDSASDVARPARRAGVFEDNDAADPSTVTFADYEVVSQRDVFRPLVHTPRAAVSLDVTTDIPSATNSRGPASPARPPDPTRDLALTGIVETNAGRLALIQNVETGASAYAGVGDEAFNLRVKRIGGKTVTLGQEDREYSLAMGAKEIAEETPGSSSSGASTSASSAAQSSEGDRRGPGFGPPGRGMGYSDMMRRLEENRSRMSREQYDRARRYLEDRQRRGESYRGRGR